MSVRVHGTLTVKEIKGAKGRFCVGDLATDLGDFKVKEPILDQFEEGRYEGEFLIERLYLSSYVWRGRSATDIRAVVSEIFLDTVDEGRIDDAPSEPDPISTDVATGKRVDAEPVAATQVDTTPQDPAIAELAGVFGAEIAPLVLAGKEVKLDPTIDRAQFRIQRDKLKECGYRFDAKTQAWMAGEVNA